MRKMLHYISHTDHGTKVGQRITVYLNRISKRNEDLEMIYGILDEEENMNVRYMNQGLSMRENWIFGRNGKMEVWCAWLINTNLLPQRSGTSMNQCPST